MTPDNLLKFLENREYLHQVSYQELKSMVLQYPYSLSLRYLLAAKCQQEKHFDFDRQLKLLATYGIDRAYLYHVFEEGSMTEDKFDESILAGEDYLELKELSELEREIREELLSVEEDIVFVKNNNNATPIPDASDSEPSENEFFTLDFTEEVDLKPVKPDSSHDNEAGADSAEETGLPLDAVEVSDFLGIILDDTGEKKVLDENSLEKQINPSDTTIKESTTKRLLPGPAFRRTPVARSVFRSWQKPTPLKAFTGIELLPVPPSKNRKKIIRIKRKLDSELAETVSFAEQSLRVSSDIRSETLAKLLAEQEHFDEAIKMYEELGLLMPEKSTYFAGKIDEIQNIKNKDA